MADRPDTLQLAALLRQTSSQLLRRLRSERGFPIGQAAVLHRLDRTGTASIGELADAEGVRPQSMAQTIGDLESSGLVQRSGDPVDRRRVLISLTETGAQALATEREERDGWLARALDDELDTDHLQALAQVLPALERISRRR